MKKITLKLKSILLLLALLITSFGFSQSLLLGFETGESGGVSGDPFGGMAVPVLEAGTGTNTSRVLKIVGNTGGEVWQGINLVLTSPVQLTTTKSMTIDVFSDAAITFLVKVNGGLAGAPEAAAEVTHTGGSTWQTLTFTFNSALDGKAATANGVYKNFVIHTYWKAGETGFFPNVTKPARTFYVDNIKGVLGTPPVEPAPTVAAPTPPARPAADVKSIYSDAYTPIGILGYTGDNDTYNTTWCGATTTEVIVAGNKTHKVTGLGCEGIAFQTARFDATSFTHFHMDIWVPTTTTLDKSFNVKFSNWNGGTAEDSAIEFSFRNASTPPLPNPNPGTWISYDIPLSSFTVAAKNANRNDLVQFVISSDLGTVFYDNLYLHKNTTLSTEKFETSSVKMYPNPVNNTLTIEANSEIQRVSVYNILGQEVMNASPKRSSVTLQTSDLQKGVYMVTTEIDGNLSTSKVVKE